MVRMARLVIAMVLAGVMFGIPPALRAAGEPYELHAIIPITGSASFLGKEEQQALQVIEKQVNASGGIGGRPLRFVIEDDQSNPQVAVQLLNGVVAQKVPVVLGSSLVATCSAMAPLAVANGPVLYCFSPGIHPNKDTYVFSSSISTVDLIAVMVRYFRDVGWKKIAIITSTDATGQDAERAIDAAVDAAKTVSIVSREHFTPTDVSVSAQMAHIKGSGAEALIAWSTGTPAATLLRGAHDSDLTIPIATTNGNLTYAQMQQYAGFLPKQLLFPGPYIVAPEAAPDKRTKDALSNCYKAFAAVGVKPDLGQSLAWDPTYMVVDALKRLGPNASASALRDYLSSLKGWTGVNGPYDFGATPQRGLAQNAVAIVRWDAAKGTWIAVSKPGGAPIR